MQGAEAAPRAPWLASIRVRLLLGFLAVTLAPLALVVDLDLRSLESAVTASAYRSLHASASQTAIGVDAFVSSNLGVVATEARLPDLVEYLAAPPERRQGAAREQILRVLESLTHRDRTFISSYALLDLRGRVVADSAGDAPAGELSDGESFRGALETGLGYASSVVFADGGAAYLDFSAPVEDRAAHPVGVLRLRYSATVLQRLVARASGTLGPGSFAMLVDENGLRLAHGDTTELAYRLATPLPPARAAVLAAEHRLPRSLADRAEAALPLVPEMDGATGPELHFTARLGRDGGRSAGAVVLLATRPWRIAALQPEEAFLEPVREQTRRSLTFAIPLALAAALFAMMTASRLAGPIARLTAAARRVAAGDLAARAEVRTGDEIGTLAATFDDMTARIREREAALAAETERLGVTLRSIGDGVITTDVAGRVALVNAAAERLTGWSQAEAAGQPIQDVFRVAGEREPAAREGLLEEVIRTGQAATLRDRAVLIARDGTRRAVADSVAPIRDAAGGVVGAVLVFRDVTEKQKLEAELAKMEKLESLGLLAGGIAHDLNNILAAIVGNVSIMKLDGAPTRFREEVDEIEAAAMRAAALSKQLLTFSRGGAPVKQSASIAEIIETSARFVLHGSSVRCELALPPDLPAVEVDPGQMDQVVHNLILNAVQAMPDGGTVAIGAAEIEIGPAERPPLQPGRYVEFTVRDRGVGIPPEHLGKIFDPYFTTKASGTGLGLATVYSIVKQHEGHITVESAPGAGATFHVFVPVAMSRGAPGGSPPGAPRRGRGRVLVVDDEEPVRRLAVRMLRQLGYEPEAAGDGVEALRLYGAALRGERFAAVVMDLTLPGGLGGEETLRRLRELDPGVRAIVSSGYSSDPVMSDHRRHGFRGVVAKPYTAEQLAEALHQALAGA